MLSPLILLTLVFFLLTSLLVFFVSINDPPTPAIYTLSLHDALPISQDPDDKTPKSKRPKPRTASLLKSMDLSTVTDRKSSRLNSSHVAISYAVFCLKKKKTNAEIIVNRYNHGIPLDST